MTCATSSLILINVVPGFCSAEVEYNEIPESALAGSAVAAPSSSADASTGDDAPKGDAVATGAEGGGAGTVKLDPAQMTARQKLDRDCGAPLSPIPSVHSLFRTRLVGTAPALVSARASSGLMRRRSCCAAGLPPLPHSAPLACLLRDFVNICCSDSTLPHARIR